VTDQFGHIAPDTGSSAQQRRCVQTDPHAGDVT
jgi:hypothetical protein